MGLSVNQDVLPGGVVDWSQSQTPLRSGTVAELPEPPLLRRQQNPVFLKCPRCGSTNTKFCYFNNYNKSQPRHFCKACKRHWTKGGTLRNVPVGGCRKNKRARTSNPSTDSRPSTAAAVASVHKIMSNLLLYQAMSPLLSDASEIKSPVFVKNPTTWENAKAETADSSVSEPQIESTDFPFSSLSTNFDMNPCLNSTPCPYWNLDSAEESVTTTANIPTTDSVQWQTTPATGNATSLPNLWNWEQIDELASSDFSVPWYNDDAEIKY